MIATVSFFNETIFSFSSCIVGEISRVKEKMDALFYLFIPKNENLPNQGLMRIKLILSQLPLRY